MIKGLLFILTILLSNLTFGQNCSCADNFVWLKETFEKNDAGFQYVIDRKGEADYKKHTEIYSEKVKAITDKKLCDEALLNWLRYFRRGHLSLISTTPQLEPKSENVNNDSIRNFFLNCEKYTCDEKEFNTYISKLKEPGLEGIWSSPPYTLGVRKVNSEYIGFILEADGIYWSKGQVKFRIKDDNGILTATYYLRDHKASPIKKIQILGNNYLKMDFVFLKRIAPTFMSSKSFDMFLRFQSTVIPICEKLSNKTVILRIPTFVRSSKSQIDSIINANIKTITTTENLIIDVRNNRGGVDESYENLIPLIYTNPIRTDAVEYLSTTMNNNLLLETINDPFVSERYKEWVKESVEKLNKHIGEFVNLDSTTFSTLTYDSIYNYPKNVGIIIDGGCGSTTEQFILAAKQSKKVKLFGVTTFGSLDFSNIITVNSPCNDLELGYCLTKSNRMPDFPIDENGLQPDYFLDNTIPVYEWIDFVNKTLCSP